MPLFSDHVLGNNPKTLPPIKLGPQKKSKKRRKKGQQGQWIKEKLWPLKRDNNSKETVIESNMPKGPESHQHEVRQSKIQN